MGFKLRTPSFRSAEKEVSRASDRAEDTVSDAWDDVEDEARRAEETIEDTYKYVVQPIIEFTNEVLYESTIAALDSVDFVLHKGLGISGSMDFLYDVNEGAKYLLDEIADGNWKAIKAGVVIAVMIVLTIFSFGAAAPILSAAMTWGINSVGAALLVTLAAASIASSIYSLYGLAVSIADIGEAIRNGSSERVVRQAADNRAMMDLAFTNAWINGSMNMWMAGGILYDSPRAGDVRFNVDGHLATTHFLNLEDHNTSVWSEWQNENYHEYATETFGNLAGDEFFSISPLAQRI